MNPTRKGRGSNRTACTQRLLRLQEWQALVFTAPVIVWFRHFILQVYIAQWNNDGKKAKLHSTVQVGDEAEVLPV